MERGEGALLLKERVKNKIDFLREKQQIQPIEVYNLIRVFFKKYFGNEYEYTRDELLKELDSIYLEQEEKERFKDVIRRLGTVEFADPGFSQEELHEILDEFDRAVDVFVETDTKHLGFWEWVVKKFQAKVQGTEQGAEETLEEEMDELEDIASGPEVEQLELTEDEARERFHDTLDTFYGTLEQDVTLAEERYEELLAVYESMDEAVKDEFYDAINKAYTALDDAIHRS